MSKNVFNSDLDGDIIAIKVPCRVRFNFSNTGQQ